LKAYSDIFGTSEKALRLRSKRVELIASNIANADMFEGRRFDFKKIMQKELGQKSNTYNDTMEYLESRVSRIRANLKSGAAHKCS
jgi:flagellar basal body rod protein FlgB